jgi:hypothetical protein
METSHCPSVDKLYVNSGQSFWLFDDSVCDFLPTIRIEVRDVDAGCPVSRPMCEHVTSAYVRFDERIPALLIDKFNYAMLSIHSLIPNLMVDNDCRLAALKFNRSEDVSEPLRGRMISRYAALKTTMALGNGALFSAPPNFTIWIKTSG